MTSHHPGRIHSIVSGNSPFKGLHSDGITLYLIEHDNLGEIRSMMAGFPDSEEMVSELEESYLAEFDEDGRRMKYGFYALLDGELAGMSLLGIDDWKRSTGYTGADTFMHMRGRGVAPRSKPHLFYLAFEMLGLHRLESGCLVSNIASKHSIEKTKGFQLEGRFRESGLNEKGEFEDEYRYAILRSDWLKHYDPAAIEILR